MKKILFGLIGLMILSCSDDDATPPVIVDPALDSNNIAYYINAKVDGVQFSSAQIITGIQTTYGSSMSYYGLCGANMNYGPNLYPQWDESLPSMGVDFVNLLGNAGLGCYDELQNFETLLSPGTYNYTLNSSTYGVGINYSKGNVVNKFYNSYGAQDSSATFTIISVTPGTCVSKCVDIVGTFSARIYNQSDANDYIDVTEGTFKLNMSSYN